MSQNKRYVKYFHILFCKVLYCIKEVLSLHPFKQEKLTRNR